MPKGDAPPETTKKASGTIVVAEDDTAFRTLLAGELRKDGYDVVEVEDGDALIRHVESEARIERKGTDLIITDVEMPRMSGLAAISALGAKGLRVRFLCIAAFCSEDTRRSALSLGACAVMSKPFDLDDLRQLVRFLLRTPTPAQSA